MKPKTLTLLILSAIVIASVACGASEEKLKTMLQQSVESHQFKLQGHGDFTPRISSISGTSPSTSASPAGLLEIKFLTEDFLHGGISYEGDRITSLRYTGPCAPSECADPYISKILRTIDEEFDFKYSRISIVANIEQCDDFGNCQGRAWVRATFNKETVDRINWPRFDPDKITDIADGYYAYRNQHGF